MHFKVRAYFTIALGDFSAEAQLLIFLAISTNSKTNNLSANRQFLYNFFGLYANFSGAKYYLLSLLCTNLMILSLSLNFYNKILNLVNRFVQLQFLNSISES